MSEDGGMKFDIEKIKQNARYYNFAVTVQNAVEKIFQRTKKEVSEIAKMKGGYEILKRIEKELDQEGIGIVFTKKILCSKCGNMIDGDEDNFHIGDKFFCLKCGFKKVLEDGRV